MATIGYERNVDLTPALQAAVAAIGGGNPAALGVPLLTALQFAKTACLDAAVALKPTIEAKTGASGHPWFGKRITWRPARVSAVLRDGQVVVQTLFDYDVEG